MRAEGRRFKRQNSEFRPRGESRQKGKHGGGKNTCVEPIIRVEKGGTDGNTNEGQWGKEEGKI